MVSTVPLVCVVIFNENSVLLVEKIYDDGSVAYGLPSGKIKEKESPIRGALEAAEEKTGLRLKDIRDVGEYSAVVSRGEGWMHTKRILAFYSGSFEGDMRPSGRNRPFWVGLDFVDNYNLLPNVKKIILDAFNHYKLKTSRDVQFDMYS
jgi:ADP-ribose pyrophosphatase YjhB (NUDIX family)